MRDDLQHIIINTGRSGGYSAGKGLNKKNKNIEEAPLKESTSRYRTYGWAAKETSDRLAPLFRMLEKNVGRNWDDFFSEFCKVYSGGKGLRNFHLKDHLMSYIEFNTQMINGKVCDSLGMNCENNIFPPFYIHPLTKTIHKGKERKKYKWTCKKEFIKDGNVIYFISDGLWFSAELVPIQSDTKYFDYFLKKSFYRPFQALDIRLKKCLSNKEYVKMYGSEVFPAIKKQLGKSDIKKLYKKFEKEIAELSY